MKKYSLAFLSFCFAFANVYAQEFPQPTIPSPESTFYTYLNTEYKLNLTKLKGKINKIVRTVTENENASEEKVTMYLNNQGKLEKTVLQYYTAGVEDYTEELNHLETPKATIKKTGNRIVKIIERTPSAYEDGMYDVYSGGPGNDHYVYENDRLITFHNYNDSINYAYDAKGRLVEIRRFTSHVLDEYIEPSDSLVSYRSEFENTLLERVTYENDLVISKEFYEIFGSEIDVYKTNYSYTKKGDLESFTMVKKSYLESIYDQVYQVSLPIEKQKYSDFSESYVKTSRSSGTFTYSKKNRIQSYQKVNGREKEAYEVTYNQIGNVETISGNLQVIYLGKLEKTRVFYEFIYDKKGNPKNIKHYTYDGEKKVLDKETMFAFEYY